MKDNKSKKNQEKVALKDLAPTKEIKGGHHLVTKPPHK